MPIRTIIKDEHVFSPEDTKNLIDAFEDTLRTLQLKDRDDPLRQITNLAKGGERDPAQLRERALKTIRGD